MLSAGHRCIGKNAMLLAALTSQQSQTYRRNRNATILNKQAPRLTVPTLLSL